MVLLYMGTFTIFYHQYPPNVSIYTSTMDPMGDERIPYFLRKGHLGTSSLYMWRYHEHMHTHTYAYIYINIYMLTCRCKKCCKLWTVGSVFFFTKKWWNKLNNVCYLPSSSIPRLGKPWFGSLALQSSM